MPTSIAGRYTVISQLGSGGMGTVVLARDEVLQRDVAIKRVHASAGPDAARRIDREAKLGAGLTHPGLVTIFDTIVDQGDLVIVMEHVEGETLGQRLEHGPMKPAEALGVLRPVAEALDHAHAHGIVHRDVKPANVLLGQRGTVKLADLGVAFASDVTSITRDGAMIGSLPYMAPELFVPERATSAADVWALAAVAFECLSGRRARPGSSPLEHARAATKPPPELRDAAPDLPAAASTILAAGMAESPSARPPSATALIDDLEAALSPETSATTAAHAPTGVSPISPAASPATSPTGEGQALTPGEAAAAAAGAAASAEATPTPVDDPPAPAGDPTPTPTPVEDATPMPALPKDPTPTPAPPDDPTPTPAPAKDPTPTPATAAKDPTPATAPAAAGARTSEPTAEHAVPRSATQRRAPAPAAGRPAAAEPSKSGRRRGALLAAAALAVLIALVAAVTFGSGGEDPASERAADRSEPTAESGGAAASGGGAGETAAADPADPSTPAGAVRAFYELAAEDDFAGSYALAGPEMRAAFGGSEAGLENTLGTLESITFKTLTVGEATDAGTPVTVETVARHTDRTDRCSGELLAVPNGDGFVVEPAGVSCTSS